MDLDLNAQYTVCSCDHTTNFGVIFDVTGALAGLDGAAVQFLNILSSVLCGLSALCCLVTFVVLQTSR
jgi:hypothetical protein